MFRPAPWLCLFAFLSSGCFPRVTEPVGDIDKAEPDKNLIGTWKGGEKGEDTWIVDQHDVKGNPKSLMRMTTAAEAKKNDRKDIWFFVTAIGKHTYLNGLAEKGDFADLSKEGAYAAWAKTESRGYLIFCLKVEKHKAIVHYQSDTSERAYASLMNGSKFANTGGFYKTPPGWFQMYLEKHGPDAVYDKSLTYTRENK